MITDWITSAKQALALVKGIDREKLPTAQQGDLVSLGQQLWSVLKHGEETLDVIKDRLRADAAASPKTVRFDGPDAHCMVVPQVDSVLVSKDADMPALKAKIGADKFHQYFEEVLVYKPCKTLRADISSEEPPVVEAVLGVLNVTPRTSRVSFEDV